MSSQRVRIILLTGVLLITLVITASLILTFATEETTLTTLPETKTSASASPVTPGGGSVSNSNGAQNVSVNTGNVQAVISYTSRQENYTRHIRCESYYNGGVAVYDINVTVTENGTAMEVGGDGAGKHILLAGGKLYIWYENEKDYRVGPADSLGNEPRLSDEFQMIPTYEDILKLDVSAIQEAGFTTFGKENCIFVKYVSGALQYRTICYISVASGLITGAEQYSGSTLVYRMTSSDYQPTVTDNSAFNLPDGKNALSVPGRG